jgi:hypothetical protein
MAVPKAETPVAHFKNLSDFPQHNGGRIWGVTLHSSHAIIICSSRGDPPGDRVFGETGDLGKANREAVLFSSRGLARIAGRPRRQNGPCDLPLEAATPCRPSRRGFFQNYGVTRFGS